MTRLVALLLACLVAGTTLAYAVAPGFAPGETTRVSVTSDGAPSANGGAQSGILSRDGRYAVFASSASNLPGANGALQVYRHDRVTGQTVLASAALGGGAAQMGAFSPGVSGDGRYVAFMSFGADLAAGDTNGALDVFVRDMTDGVTVAASTTATGAFVSAGGSLASFVGARTVSDDGRFVAFTSPSSELVAGPNNGVAQAYVKDLVAGGVVLASVGASGAAGNAASVAAVMSGDGGVVAFQTASTNLSRLATSGAPQVYVRDLDAATTTLASVATPGLPMTFFQSAAPGLSYDGGAVVFETQAALVPCAAAGPAGDCDGAWDVYLRDLAAGTTTLASPSANTSFGVDSREPAISGDGSLVGFRSIDTGLVAGDVNRTADVFLFARATGLLTLVSLNDDGVQANGPSVQPSLSSDGTQVLFASTATNLVATPGTGLQMYVRDLATNAAPVLALVAEVSLLEGEALHVAGSFSDDDASTSWTATVDWGEEAGAETLDLAGDKTFALAHPYAPGTYTVTVTVSDDQGATGSAALAVTVTNVAPAVVLPATAEVGFGTTLGVSGSFGDPGTGETYAATVGWGDGTPVEPLALDVDPAAAGASGSFQLVHTYAAAGTYTVTVALADGNGGATSVTMDVVVRAYTFVWLEPVGETFSAGRLLPVKFEVLAADGSSVLDTSVRVEARDASGAVVAGPYAYGDQPSRSVTVDGDGYHVNLDGRALDPHGTYALVVAFSSPQLTDEVSLPSAPDLARRAR